MIGTQYKRKSKQEMTITFQVVHDRGQFATRSTVPQLSLGERFAGVADDLQNTILHLLEHAAHRELVRVSVQDKSTAVQRHGQDRRIGQTVLERQEGVLLSRTTIETSLFLRELV